MAKQVQKKENKKQHKNKNQEETSMINKLVNLESYRNRAFGVDHRLIKKKNGSKFLDNSI